MGTAPSLQQLTPCPVVLFALTLCSFPPSYSVPCSDPCCGGIVSSFPACPLAPTPSPPAQTFQYHSREWIANLNARPDCKVVPMADAHWLMAGPTAAEYEEAVLGWLATTIGPREGAPAGAAPVAAAPVAAVGTAAAPAEEGKKDL